MKKVGILLILLFFLTGCTDASEEIERGMVLRDKLLSSQCSFDADITTDYGDTIHQFSMSCQGDIQGNLTFSVTQPETISGITGTVSDTGGKLTFDDAALQFALMADDQITPVTAPWIFLKTLRSGYLTSAGMEGALLRLSIDDSYEDDALHLDIWLDESNTPVRTEILYDNRRILSIDVKNFSIQ